MLNSDNILLILEYRWNARYSEVVGAGAPSLHMADAVIPFPAVVAALSRLCRRFYVYVFLSGGFGLKPSTPGY